MKNILMEPYHVTEAVTDELVDVLLSPLLLPGAADVVFDTLSYSAVITVRRCFISIFYGEKLPLSYDTTSITAHIHSNTNTHIYIFIPMDID